MQELTAENFDQVVSQKLTLVDFNADWCGPCQMQAPILETLSKASDSYQIASVDIDAQPELAEKFSVSSIPCLILFQDGKEVERLIGLRPQKALEKLFAKYLGV